MNKGSKPAWCEDLYRAKAAELLLYGRAIGLSHCEAEDVLQETFLALIEREFPPENAVHYAIRSFRNRATNYHRSLWRRLTRELEASRWFDHSPGESPLEHAAMRCLENLPAVQREVIVLKVWHEFTFEQIGALLDVSPNTVAGRYRYGLQKLKTCLEGENHEQNGFAGSAIEMLESARSIGGH